MLSFMRMPRADAPGAGQRRGWVARSLQPGACVSAGGSASPHEEAPGALEAQTPRVTG